MSMSSFQISFFYFQAMALQELQHPYVCGYKEFFVKWDKEVGCQWWNLLFHELKTCKICYFKLAISRFRLSLLMLILLNHTYIHTYISVICLFQRNVLWFILGGGGLDIKSNTRYDVVQVHLHYDLDLEGHSQNIVMTAHVQTNFPWNNLLWGKYGQPSACSIWPLPGRL